MNQETTSFEPTRPAQTPARLARIVSGGRTGVDRAALDAAMATGLGIAGYCPAGRTADDGPLPERYPLRETPSPDGLQRTVWNVLDSDATLILTKGPFDSDAAHTVEAATRHGKPLFLVDLAAEADPAGARVWLRRLHVRTLNVAGPNEVESPGIYAAARRFMERLLER